MKKNKKFYGLWFLRKIWIYIKSSFMASWIISLSTAPLMAFHFHHISFQGVLSNIVAIAWTIFCIFPLGIFCVISLFCPWEYLRIFLFYCWSFPLDFLITLASFFSQNAQWMVVPMVPFSPVYLLWLMMSMLWFFLWRCPWRFFGLGFSLMMLCFLYFFPQRPKFFLHSQIPLMAFYSEENNTLYMSSLKKGGLVREKWTKFYPTAFLKKATLDDFALYFQKVLPKYLKGQEQKKLKEILNLRPSEKNITPYIKKSFIKSLHRSCCYEWPTMEGYPFSLLWFSPGKIFCHHGYFPLK